MLNENYRLVKRKEKNYQISSLKGVHYFPF